jgi:hypothetical protein
MADFYGRFLWPIFMADFYGCERHPAQAGRRSSR